jgi:hypothetical protein
MVQDKDEPVAAAGPQRDLHVGVGLEHRLELPGADEPLDEAGAESLFRLAGHVIDI